MAIRKGGKELTSRQTAAYIRGLTGWTIEEYNKKLDVFRNKVRTYEQATGAPRGTYNAQDIFARDIRGQIMGKRLHTQYVRPNLTEAILATPARSSGGKRTVNPETGEIERTYISGAARARVEATAKAAVRKQFHGLLEKSQIAKDAVKALGSKYTAAQLEEALKWAARQSKAVSAGGAAYNARQSRASDRIFIDESP